jgi:GTP-binding protein
MPKMTFIKSAVKFSEFPVHPLKEIAIAGRSNAGKSSILNIWAREKIAKVSQTPGKTRLLNFFAVGKNYCLVDMPGYGFASRGGDEIKTWRKMIEGYLSQREQLVGLILIIDMAREWQDDEEAIAQYVMKHDIPVAVVLTKCDKFSKNDIEKAVSRMKQQSRLEDVFAASSQTKVGCDEVENFMYKTWVKA